LNKVIADSCRISTARGQKAMYPSEQPRTTEGCILPLVNESNLLRHLVFKNCKVAFAQSGHKLLLSLSVTVIGSRTGER